MNAVQRLEHENMAKQSKQTTEGKRGEKVGEREGGGGGMEEGAGGDKGEET